MSRAKSDLEFGATALRRAPFDGDVADNYRGSGVCAPTKRNPLILVPEVEGYGVENVEPWLGRRAARPRVIQDINVLVIAIEAERWATACMIQPLSEAGLHVASLSPQDSPVASSRFIEKRFRLPSSRSSRRLEDSLSEAMQAWRPQLIVPADEQVVAWLQTLVRRGVQPGRRLTLQMLATIQASLGNIEQFDAMLLKSHTLALARTLGIRVPAGATIGPEDDAVAIAQEIGFPLYLKTSFSWSGKGVRRCKNAAEVADGVKVAPPNRRRPLHKLLRRIAKRDWYPNDTAMDLQQAIAGTPAMYCAVAMEGRVLAGYGGIAVRNLHENGPASVVRLLDHEEMAEASTRMIQAMGASGFIAFDFMIDWRTGAAFMLECNPRPIQIGQWGRRFGVDLCAALAAALRGETPPTIRPVAHDLTVALFPQEWMRDPVAFRSMDLPMELPWDDPGLMRLMLNAASPSST